MPREKLHRLAARFPRIRRPVKPFHQSAQHEIGMIGVYPRFRADRFHFFQRVLRILSRAGVSIMDFGRALRVYLYPEPVEGERDVFSVNSFLYLYGRVPR